MLGAGSGHIVNITATIAEQPMAALPAALAALTKGGLNAVTRSLAIEYAQRGVRVNAVAPGVIRTPMHAPETHTFLAGLQPMGRMGETQDVVDAVLYLEKATFVTGEILHVDGGASAGAGENGEGGCDVAGPTPDRPSRDRASARARADGRSRHRRTCRFGLQGRRPRLDRLRGDATGARCRDDPGVARPDRPADQRQFLLSCAGESRRRPRARLARQAGALLSRARNRPRIAAAPHGSRAVRRCPVRDRRERSGPRW